MAADELASYSSDLNSLDYCIWDILQNLVYEGWRLPFAYLQDLKEAIKNKWKEVTIETIRKSVTQWKNDWMQLESRMEAWFSSAVGTFSANRCEWISISCSETCWTYWLFCTFRTPSTLLRISLSKQKRITSGFLILFSYDCSLKMLFHFVWILLLSSTTKLGTFFYELRGIYTGSVKSTVELCSGVSLLDGRWRRNVSDSTRREFRICRRVQIRRVSTHHVSTVHRRTS